MDTADFLFPRELEVTPTPIRKLLFIGSCLADVYVKRLREQHPEREIDFILFNNVSNLPKRSDEEIGRYDLQYIQLPLRSVLTDAVIRIADNDKLPESIAWLELGKRNIDLMLDSAMAYNSQAGLLSFVSTFIVPQRGAAPSLLDSRSESDLCWIVAELNNYLARTIKRFKHAYLADVDMIASALGRRFFLDDFIGFYTHGSVHYPDWGLLEGKQRIDPIPLFVEIYENRIDEFFAAVFRQIEVLYRTVHQTDMVKVVIFDLDNTLWRGQLVEDYQPGEKWPHSHGWPLGIWEAVHHLRRRGIMTSIASKNDHHVVEAKWADAVQPPFVKFEDFIAPQINWLPKADNIATILQQLSLTPKSAVFVDDNPVERESVKAALPGIRVIGSNPFLTRRILLWSAETQISSRSQESIKREEMLRQQIEREGQKTAMSRDEFLAGLQSTIKLWEIFDTNHRSFARVSELVNKTNQFNTSGARWDVANYIRFFAERGRVFAFSVADRFTDYGTVGVIFTKGAEIVQYVMSCRVLGMEVEVGALNSVAAEIRGDQLIAIHGHIVETDVNTPCRDVFVRSGFVPAPNVANAFELVAGSAATVPVHLKIEFEGDRQMVEA